MDQLSGTREERGQFFKRILGASFVALTFYCIFYLALGARLSALTMFVGIILLTPLTFLAENLAHPTLARLLFILSCSFYTCMSSLGARNQGGVEYYFLPLAGLPFLLFETDRRKAIAATLPIPLLSWALMSEVSIYEFSNFWVPTHLPTEALRIINFLAALVIMGVFLFIFIGFINRLKNRIVSEAQDREQYLRNIFESMQEGLLIQDDQGKIIQVNPTALEILGLTEMQMLGRTSTQQHWKVLKEDGTPFPVELAPTSLALSTGESQRNVIARVARPDGAERWLLINATPIYQREPSTGTQLRRVLCTFSDMTTQKLAEYKLLQAAKMSSLGEMAGGIAHEINTPLAIINGKAHFLKELAQQGNLDAAKLKLELEKIENTSLRIAKIIKGLRTFSRNSEKDPMTPSPFFQIVEDTLELCTEHFRTHRVDLRIQFDQELVIDCRAAQISEVLLNLLRNALDAVDSLNEKWVALETQVIDGFLQIRITDSGPPISPEVATRLMQPFFTTKEVGKGTGLGLSISKGIIEEHGGQLRYDPTHPTTRFIIDLPIKHRKERSA